MVYDKKKLIEIVVRDDVVYELETSFDGVIQFLNDIKALNPDLSNFTFDITYDWDGDKNIRILANRYETDEEFTKRIEKNEKQKKVNVERKMKSKLKKDEKDKKIYERLREKYEGV